MRLNLVSFRRSFLGLDQVARFREVGDDPVGAALRDVQGRRDAAMRTSGSWAMHSSARPWLVRKFQVVTMTDIE